MGRSRGVFKFYGHLDRLSEMRKDQNKHFSWRRIYFFLNPHTRRYIIEEYRAGYHRWMFNSWFDYFFKPHGYRLLIKMAEGYKKHGYYRETKHNADKGEE